VATVAIRHIALDKSRGEITAIGANCIGSTAIKEQNMAAKTDDLSKLLPLKHLAAAAGVRQFEAEVLAENRPMLAVFKRSGLAMRQNRDGGIMHVTLALD
jgi:hypothetical protein